MLLFSSVLLRCWWLGYLPSWLIAFLLIKDCFWISYAKQYQFLNGKIPSSALEINLISVHCCWVTQSCPTLRLHGLQHARLPCPSLSPGTCLNSCPLSRWCHPTISSSVIPSPHAFNLSQHQGLFQWVRSLHQVPKVLKLSHPMLSAMDVTYSLELCL